MSKKQIDRLGDRLRDADVPNEADLSLLESVLACYDEVLEDVAATLRGLGHEPTVRTKTTGTLIDKLRRNHSSSLKTIQDLAGARIVIAGRASDQDRVCGELVERFRTDDYEPSIDDRRSTPSAGYRAVHVIVRVEGLPAEIQVRTELQDLWAQIFERLGDAWGRQIRYGGSPDPVIGSPSRDDLRVEVMAHMAELSRQISVLEEEQDEFQEWPPVHGDGISEGDEGWELVKLAKRHVVILQKLEDSVRKSLDIIGGLIEKEGEPK